MKLTGQLRATLATMALVAPWLATSAQAQEAAARDGERQSGLNEIIVTAQKRVESLQDTPLAVSAIDTEALEQRGIKDISDLSSAAPNLTVSQGSAATSNPTVLIRGIGDNDPILTNDSAVGTYVDGVIIGRSAGSLFDMVDLERVEVLRGPQGTLYGRNTTGGAVNLISAKPTRDANGKASLSYGNFNEIKAKASFNSGEFGDSGFAFQLSLYHYQRDGTVDNLNQPKDSQDPGSRNVDAVRAALRYDKGDGLTLDYAYDFNDRHGHANAFQLRAMRPDILAYLNNSPTFGGASPVVSPDHLREINLDYDGDIHDKVQGHTFTANIDLTDKISFKSITGYRKWDNWISASDLSGNGGLVGFLVSPAVLAPPYDFIPEGIGPVNLFHTTNERHQHQFSQEFNLIGSSGEFQYVAGLYYFREKASEHNPQYFTLILPSPVPIPITPDVTYDSFGVNIGTLLDYRHTSRSMAAFGQATWTPAALNDKLSVTGGLRYTEDKKHLMQTSSFNRDLTSSFSKVNWLANIAYKWTDDVMTYARASTGYKAGGFNARSANSGFGPENLISYEVGLKSELFDRRLRFNLAGFYSTYNDLQVQQFLAGSGGATSVTVNAGKARYAGIEGEVEALLAEGLTVNAAVGYVDRKYERFDFLDPTTNEIVDVADTARFQNSASTTINLGAQYETRLGDFAKLIGRLDWNYRSGVHWSPLGPYNNAIADGSVGLLNGRLSVSDIDLGGTQATVSLWGKNLTNEDYLYAGIDFGSLGFAGVNYGDPRSYGVEVAIKF